MLLNFEEWRMNNSLAGLALMQHYACDCEIEHGSHHCANE